jgi:O-6-methylguanine DNA methyltransferase
MKKYITTENNTMKFAFYRIEFGIIKIGYNDRAVTSIEMAEGVDVPDEPSKLSDRVFDELGEYFAGIRKTFDIQYEFHGTAFQEKVWHALAEIPYGETRSYEEIARVVGSPKACRAVGMANNKNPIWIIVPCHRVIGKDGSLVGYGGGLEMKRRLLELEKRTFGV